MNNVMQQFRLDGKVVIVTGGAGLLGRQHAQAIAEAGGIPVLLDINSAALKKATHVIKGESLGLKADITKVHEIKKVKGVILKKYKTIDALINNAANNPKVTNRKGNFKKFHYENFSLEQWRKDLEMGLTGAFICSQVFGTYMAKKKRGNIINISSDLGLIGPDQRVYTKKGIQRNNQAIKPVTYSVMKHGLLGLTKYCATYWADAGIRVNALCPGGIFENQSKEFITKLSGLIPLGRMAREDEYKAAIVFLLSDASTYMTGSILTIDGGRTCW